MLPKSFYSLLVQTCNKWYSRWNILSRWNVHLVHSASFLTRMRDYMPPSHRCFIEEISRVPCLRAFVLKQANEGLTEVYDQCVVQLVSLRSYHITVVSRFITVPASQAKQLRSADLDSLEEHNPVQKAPTALEERGTGGSGIMSFLKTVRDRTKDVLSSQTAVGSDIWRSGGGKSSATWLQKEVTQKVTYTFQKVGRVKWKWKKMKSHYGVFMHYKEHVKSWKIFNIVTTTVLWIQH